MGSVYAQSWLPQSQSPVSQYLPSASLDLSLSLHGGHFARGSCSQVCGEALDPGFTVEGGKWGENLRLSQNSAWADHRQVGTDSNSVISAFSPSVCDLEPVSLFLFSEPGSHDVALAVLELAM